MVYRLEIHTHIQNTHTHIPPPPKTKHAHTTSSHIPGLVLASDGKKMSKRLKNYPPPDDILDKYGADALRLYLISSPVVRE